MYVLCDLLYIDYRPTVLYATSSSGARNFQWGRLEPRGSRGRKSPSGVERRSPGRGSREVSQKVKQFADIV